jgi:hypothetical protein
VPECRGVDIGARCYVKAQLVLANLARCPAWNSSGPCIHVGMKGMNDDNFRLHCSQLLPAVCPLSKTPAHHVCMQGFEGVLNASLLAALGRAVGTSLTHLQLQGCPLSPDFWPAGWVHLPVLRTLHIRDSPRGPVKPKHLVAFCRSATCPVQPQLGGSFHPELRLEVHRQKQSVAQGRQLVLVIT